MGYAVAMRVHISLEDELLARLDERVGARHRSAFIEKAVQRALDDLVRADSLERALGAIDDSGHEWDDDPAGWVRSQRADQRRVG